MEEEADIKDINKPDIKQTTSTPTTRNEDEKGIEENTKVQELAQDNESAQDEPDDESQSHNPFNKIFVPSDDKNLKESKVSFRSTESVKNDAFIQESDTSWTNESITNETFDRNKISKEDTVQPAEELKQNVMDIKSKQVEKLYQAESMHSEDDMNANQELNKPDLGKTSNTSRITKSFEVNPTTSVKNESESSSKDTRAPSDTIPPSSPEKDGKEEYNLVEFQGRVDTTLTCAVAVDVLPNISPIMPVPELKKEEIKPLEIVESIPDTSPAPAVPKSPEVEEKEVEEEVEIEKPLPAWMEKPLQIPSHCPPGLEYLSELDTLNIFQTGVYDSWISAINYTVKNKFGQNVYQVDAHMPACFLNFVCTNYRRYEISFLDRRGTEVMRFIRPAAAKGRRCLNVYAPCGELIGRVSEKNNNPPFYVVLDRANEVLYRVETKRRPFARNIDNSTFSILPVTGQQIIGQIHLETNGFMKSVKHSNYYSLQYYSNLDAKIKASILGASFLINFIHYELF